MSSYTKVRPHPSRSATSLTVSSGASARTPRSCGGRTDVSDCVRTATSSRNAGSSKVKSDWVTYPLYSAGAYRLLTLCAIAGVRASATASSMRCPLDRDTVRPIARTWWPWPRCGTAPAPDPHAPRRAAHPGHASAPNAVIHIVPRLHLPPSPDIFPPHASLSFLDIAPSHHRQLHLRWRPLLNCENVSAL